MLTRIKVKNFKSLKDVTLDLSQRNVLVGANMAGKSNIIDLLKFIYQVTYPGAAGTWALPNAVSMRGGFGELLWKGGDEQIISIALSGMGFDDGAEWPWNYEISIQGDVRGNFRVAQEKLQVRRRKVPEFDDLIETVGFERWFCNVNRGRLSSMNDSTRSMLEFEIPDWHGNFLRSEIASWRFYELVAPIMRNPNPTAAAMFLSEHGENLSQWLLNLQTRYTDSFARIQSVLRDALPQVSGLFTWPTQQSTVVLGSNEKHLIRPVTLAQMSAGELVFIAFLSLIFGPQELTGSLYCVEDIENYLHPGLIETLLEVLRQSQKEWETKHRAAQIVMTTHSPLVVDKMKLDEIVFVEKRNGATVCSRPGDKSHLKKLLQNEEIGLGDLVYSGALSDVGK
jgi:predicted ATPase